MADSLNKTSRRKTAASGIEITSHQCPPIRTRQATIDWSWPFAGFKIQDFVGAKSDEILGIDRLVPLL
jgi:hypothetical protein